MNHELGTIVSRIDHQFYLPPDITSSLDKYYILHWQGSYLLDQVNLYPTADQALNYSEDILTHQEISYRIKLLGGLSAWYIVQNPTYQYKLSFRKLHKKSTGFVLIKKA